MGTCFQSGRGKRQCPPRGERNGTATRISSTNGKRCERDFLTSFLSCYRGNTRARGRNISCYRPAMVIRDLRNSLQDCPGSSLSVSLLRSSVGEGRALDRTRRADLACRHPYVGTLDCHSVIASCILCTLSLRRDETWLLECLVHCDASAGVDRISQRALIAGSLRSSGLRDRLPGFCVPATESQPDLATRVSQHDRSSTHNIYYADLALSGTHLHGHIFALYPQ